MICITAEICTNVVFGVINSPIIAISHRERERWFGDLGQNKGGDCGLILSSKIKESVPIQNVILWTHLSITMDVYFSRSW